MQIKEEMESKRDNLMGDLGEEDIDVAYETNDVDYNPLMDQIQQKVCNYLESKCRVYNRTIFSLFVLEN